MKSTRKPGRPAAPRAQSVRPSSAPAPVPVGILVLGMHRSGTSAITRVLNLLGADLGNRLVPGVEGVNDGGFWEHVDAVALDDKLLGWHGRSWHSVQPVDTSAIGKDLLRQACRDIGTLIRRDFAASPLWAIKDPRMSLLAPVWTRALAESGVSARVVVAFRHPDEVAASLHRRDAITRAHAHLLWGTYFVSAVRSSAGVPRAICDYAGLMADWRGTAERLGNALGIQWPVAMPAAAGAIDVFLRPEQRRHHAVDSAPSDIDPLHASVLAMHAAALQIAKGDAGWDALDPVIERFERVSRHAAPHVQELLDHVWVHADRASAAEFRLARVRSADGELDQVSALREVLNEKDARLQAAGDALHRTDSAVAQLRAHVDGVEAERNSLREESEGLRRRLEVVETVIPQLQQVISEKEARLVASGEGQRRLDSALQEVQSHAAALETARAGLQRQFDVAEALRVEKDAALALALSRQERLEAALSDLHGHASALESAREELRRQVDVAEAVAAEKEARLADSGARLQQLESAMAEVSSHAHALEGARDELRRRVEVSEAVVAEKEVRLADSGARLQQLESAIAEVSSHAHALESARDVLRAEVHALQGQAQAAGHLRQIVDEKDARLAAAYADLRRTETANRDLQLHASGLERGFASAQAQARALRSELDAVNQDRAQAVMLVDQHVQSAATLEDHLSLLEHELNLMRASRSWRITAPLRAVMTWMRPRGEWPGY